MTREHAVQLSIEKWEDIINDEGIDDGGFNCALCHQYIRCYECPIHKLTDKFDCRGTPYEKWIQHQTNSHLGPKRIKCNTCKRLAKKELEFLKGLLEAC